MNKNQRISEFVARLGASRDPDMDPRYIGFFKCFNQQLYYEAHDVLEDLWLREKYGGDRSSPSVCPPHTNYHFFKGLIQVAGAFVHLQKQRLRPDHPKDGRRTRPAARLFQLAADNLAGYPPVHMHLNVDALRIFCLQMKADIEGSDFAVNPWNPARPPAININGR